MVSAMDVSKQRIAREALVSRRRVLWLAGVAGLGAVATACGKEGKDAPVAEAVKSSTTSSAPALPPVIAPAPKPPGAPATLLCRDSWGARPPLPGGRPHTITRMTIHHTAVVLGDNSNAPGRLRQHQSFHQNQRGWIDIAYHVSVDRNGNIYELRSTGIAGDTATNYDPAGHFLVVCEGNFDEEKVSDAQLHGAAMAFAWAAEKFDVSSELLAGHKDASPDTACPGEDLYARLTSGELKKRVDTLLATGGVDLQTICGPQASYTVAEIEAGTQPALP